MKRALVYFTLLLLTVKLLAGNYQVNVGSELNVRSQPSTESTVIGKLQNKTFVEATILDNGWAEVNINGEKGFVNSKYLIQPQVQSSGKSASIWSPGLNWGDESYKWMAYLVGGFILAVWIFCKFIRRLDAYDDFWGTSNLEGIGAIVSGTLQMACSLLIIYYVWKTGQHALWFIMPSQVGGWGFAVMNFIFFLYALMNLMVGFLKTMDDIQFAFNSDIHMKWGAFSWIIGLAAIVFCYFFREEYIKTSFLILLAAQAIQLIIIAFNVWESGGIIGTLIAMVVYLIGSTAIVVFVCPLLVIACVILIGGTIAYFVLSLDKGSSHGSTYVSSSSDSGSSSATEFTGCEQCSNCKHWNWFGSCCTRTNDIETFDSDRNLSCVYWEWNGKD